MQRSNTRFVHLALRTIAVTIVVFLMLGLDGAPAVQARSAENRSGAFLAAADTSTRTAFLPQAPRRQEAAIIETAATVTRTVYLPLVFSNRPPRPYRMGFGATAISVDQYPEIGSLAAGWYVNWYINSHPPVPNGIEYVQTVSLHQRLTCPLGSVNAHDRTLCPYVQPYTYDVFPSLAGVIAAAKSRPGSLWLIGNEMDRRDWPGGHQDEMLPEVYATAYRDLYTAIKSVDPHAQVAIGGVIQATPLRLEYLTKVWNAYQQQNSGTPMPVDVWNVHNFIFKEVKGEFGAEIPPGSDALHGVVYGTDWSHVDMGLFDSQIRAFRQWMKERGQQDKPLIVSEYGVIYYHDGMEDPTVVQNFMLATFDYFLNTKDCNLGYAADGCRLVQRWAWYSLDDDGTVSSFNKYGALFDPGTKQITSTGIKFREYAANHYQELSR